MIIGIGTDIVQLDRLRQKDRERLAQRVLTSEERQWWPEGDVRQIEYLAGRFAAKEALSKAARTGIGRILGFQDIEILSGDNGCPKVRLSEQSRRKLGWADDVQIHLTIAHERDYAVATVVVERVPNER
ncbi:holo-ACP synthase [Polycladomyces subterraneus]|uniref:Holo-[acyl-carrier-protein] synthase n=1 Tax=Polycladomyces subterraneus TaxID=1016997 RepID=A0ABT8ILJ3_9BACL|nr:holo-ACP synthase [Polycladomyces subterraneus]MDN4593660.1 holo-ACP synthase [Polycladomyces subterraneus]